MEPLIDRVWNTLFSINLHCDAKYESFVLQYNRKRMKYSYNGMIF